MNSSKYLGILENHLPQFRFHRGYQFLMHDEAPIHMTKLVQKWLHDVVN